MTRTRAVGRHARPPLFVALLAAALTLVSAGGCRETEPARPKTDTPVTTIPLADVVTRRAPELMKIPGVVGVAEARLPDGSPCVRIYVVERTPALDRALPKTLDGWPVDVEVSGRFEALGDST